MARVRRPDPDELQIRRARTVEYIRRLADRIEAGELEPIGLCLTNSGAQYHRDGDAWVTASLDGGQDIALQLRVVDERMRAVFVAQTMDVTFDDRF